MRSDDRATRRWLQDIQRQIVLAQGFLSGMTETEFHEDTLRLYAVTRCLEIISEASRRLPEAVRARHPAIPWRAMAGAGNIYRHNYEDVAAKAVWRTATHDLPILLAVVRQELELP